MTKEKGDLKQVGVTRHASVQLQELVESQDYFGAEQDVYRLAVAVAIALGLSIPESLRKEETPVKWRVVDDLSDEGSQGSRLDDPQGTLAQMVAAFRPEYATAPYRHSRYLASMGINYLHGQIFDKRRSLHDALAGIGEKFATEGE